MVKKKDSAPAAAAAAAAAAPDNNNNNNGARLNISIEEFVRTRDSVITGLATLQNAIVDLSRLYIAHTNTVLNRPPGINIEPINLVGSLADGGLNLNAAMRPSGLLAQLPTDPVAPAGPPQKKKRYHDPNAPKRPLTPYFLYMQTARPVIARDLGPGYKPGDVSAEGTQRWLDMGDTEKDMWNKAYKKNLEAYQGRMAAYKRGDDWKTLDDAAAAQLAKEAGTQNDAIAEGDTDEIDNAPSFTAPPTPAKAGKSAKRRKTNEAADVTSAPAAVPVAPMTAASSKKTAGSTSKAPILPGGAADSGKDKEKKRKKATPKKTTTEEATPVAAAAPAESTAAPPKKRSSNKKRKSDAVNEG